jgi:hypothetical protein
MYLNMHCGQNAEHIMLRQVLYVEPLGLTS